MNTTDPITNKTEKQLYDIITKLSLINSKKHMVQENKSVLYEKFFSNKLKINSLIHMGLSYSVFEKIQDNTSFSKNDWANFLDLSVRTLDRYKNENKKFKAPQSEKIIGLIEVLERGADIFGNMHNFKLWLNTPSFALGKTKPIELLSTSYGRELVIAELTHLDYGIFA